MQIGDLIKFKGSWGPNIPSGERRTGIVMKTWRNGRTRKIQSADVLWDNGDWTQSNAKYMEVVNESR